MSITNDAPLTLNFKGASQFTGVSEATLKRRFANGQLPGYTVGDEGREIRFFVEDLKSLFVEVETKGKSTPESPRSAIAAEARSAIAAKRRGTTRASDQPA